MNIPSPPTRPLTSEQALYDWLYLLYSYVVGIDSGIGIDGVLTSTASAAGTAGQALTQSQAAQLSSLRQSIADKSQSAALMIPPLHLPRFMSIRVLSASASIAPGEFADVDATSAAVTITLPPASTNSGKMIGVAKADASANFVTLSGQVNGAATTDLTAQYTALLLISNGTEWRAW